MLIDIQEGGISAFSFVIEPILNRGQLKKVFEDNVIQKFAFLVQDLQNILEEDSGDFTVVAVMEIEEEKIVEVDHERLKTAEDDSRGRYLVDHFRNIVQQHRTDNIYDLNILIRIQCIFHRLLIFFRLI